MTIEVLINLVKNQEKITLIADWCDGYNIDKPNSLTAEKHRLSAKEIIIKQFPIILHSSIESQLKSNYKNMTSDVGQVAHFLVEHDHKYSMPINSRLLF